MKIVVLDGYTLNPGDLSWDGLKKLGDLKVYDRTSYNTKDSDLIIERVGGAEVVFTNKTPMTKEMLKEMPNLKYIGVLATGYNVVDVEAARENGIIVTNIPTYGTMAVAQMTWALLLELCNHVGVHSEEVKKGTWTNNADWCFWRNPLIELVDKNLGIIGYGRIGKAVGEIAKAFGMNVLVYDVNPNLIIQSDKIKRVELDDLLEKSDVISLHCPLFENTKGIINRDTIKLMKETAILINTSRGALVVEKDLAEALENNKIAGAAVDVVSSEPIEETNPLLKAKNIIITPHISWAPKESRTRLLDIAISNLEMFLSGTPTNVVNSNSSK